MTVNEAIKQVVTILENVNIPMAIIKTVGVPVSNAIDILRQCADYMDKQAEEAGKDGDKVGE